MNIERIKIAKEDFKNRVMKNRKYFNDNTQKIEDEMNHEQASFAVGEKSSC